MCSTAAPASPTRRRDPVVAAATDCMLLYGEPGVGKSALAAGMTEGGLTPLRYRTAPIWLWSAIAMSGCSVPTT